MQRGTQGPDPQPSPGSPHLFSESHHVWHMRSQGRGPPAMEIQIQLNSANIWGQVGVGAKSCRTSQTKDVNVPLWAWRRWKEKTAGLWLEIQSMRGEPKLRAVTASKKWAQNLRLSAREGWGEGTVREFGMDMYTLLYLKWVTNKVLLGTQGTPLNVKWQPRWERSCGGEWIHVYDWVPLLSTWSYHNIVNQLYSNMKYKVLKKKKWARKAQPNAPDMAHKVQKWCLELGRTQYLPRGRLTSQWVVITYGTRSGAGDS